MPKANQDGDTNGAKGNTLAWKPEERNAVERLMLTDAPATIMGIELVREELSRRGSDWQYIFEMEHLPLLPTKPSLIEGRYPTVGHFEGKMFSSWACEPGCCSTKPVLK